MFKSKYFKVIGSTVVITLTLAACSNAKNNTQTPSPNNAETKVEQKAVSYLYTANEGGSVSKIDLSTNKVVDTIKDDGGPHNVQVSPDGKVVAYTSPGKMDSGQSQQEVMTMNGFAVFYDTQTGKLIKKLK